MSSDYTGLYSTCSAGKYFVKDDKLEHLSVSQRHPSATVRDKMCIVTRSSTLGMALFLHWPFPPPRPQQQRVRRGTLCTAGRSGRLDSSYVVPAASGRIGSPWSARKGRGRGRCHPTCGHYWDWPAATESTQCMLRGWSHWIGRAWRLLWNDTWSESLLMEKGSGVSGVRGLLRTLPITSLLRKVKPGCCPPSRAEASIAAECLSGRHAPFSVLTAILIFPPPSFPPSAWSLSIFSRNVQPRLDPFKSD